MSELKKNLKQKLYNDDKDVLEVHEYQNTSTPRLDAFVFLFAVVAFCFTAIYMCNKFSDTQTSLAQTMYLRSQQLNNQVNNGFYGH